MQKWEYCAITGIGLDTSGSLSGYNPNLHYFSLQGTTSVDLGNGGKSKRPQNLQAMGEGEYIAYMIAKLGQEGWEMVGTGSGQSGYGNGPLMIYFRRPLA
jgi:hypothetical protein